MKHDVHIFALVRVKVCNVEAESHEAAIEKAESALNLHELLGADLHNWLGNSDMTLDCAEYAEEISHYLVDEVGDEQFDKSRWYSWFKSRLLPGCDVAETYMDRAVDMLERVTDTLDNALMTHIFDEDDEKGALESDEAKLITESIALTMEIKQGGPQHEI